jgi:hypothetical protein
MLTIAKRALIAIAVLISAIYAGDYVSILIPIPKSRQQFGSFQIHPYLAIHLKNKKVEFDFNVPPETGVCIHSLFPHFGYQTCWHMAGNTKPRIDE